mgnify:CR=1 FL=1
MNKINEILTVVAKDMPGGLPVFYAFLFLGLCATLTFILDILLAIYKTKD